MPTPDAHRPSPDPSPAQRLEGLPIEALPVATALSRHGQYLRANGAFLTLFGLASEAELKALPLVDLIAPAERAAIGRINEARERTGEGPADYETLGLRRDGRTFPIHVRVSRISLEGGDATLACITDISQRREAEEALREAHRFSQQIIQGAKEGIIVYGPDLRYQVWNPFMEALTGLPASQVLGRHPSELFPFIPESGVLDRLERILAGGSVGPIEFPFQVPGSGRVGWARDNSAPLLDARGEIIGVIGTVADITKRKQTEEALRQERTNATRYLAVAQVILVAFDAEARITLLNPKGHEVLGYQEGELVGRDWFSNCLPPEEQAEVRAVYDRILTGDLAPVEHYENHILRKDGQRRLIAWSNAQLKDEQGRIIGTLSSGEDITERRAAEQELRRTTLLLEQSHILTRMGAWSLDLASGRLDWTPEVYRLHEVDPAVFSPTLETHLDFCLPEYRTRILRAVRTAMDTGERYDMEVRVRTATGRILWIRTTGTSMFEDGRCVRLLGTLQDISERKSAEAALREREEQIRVIFEASEAGIILVSPSGEIVFANEGMAQMFGMTMKALIGTRYPDHLHASEQAMGGARMSAIIRGDVEFVSVERKFVRADGRPFWGHLSGRRLEHPDGTLRALVGIITDVTKRREAEEQQQFLQAQLHQAQKMESLGALAGGVAHDMNNVLGAILGLASAHIESQAPGSPTQKALGTIIKAAERGGNMLKSLLSFARQQSAEDRDLDLNTILREEVRLLERTTLAKVRLVMELAPDLRPIRGDAGALTHAFMNLCVNAVDAMPESGTLTLRTRNQGAEWVEVQVEDTGQGMSQEVLGRALDPFFTTKEVGKGTGLGLSIVYSTVKTHQGEMELRSAPGQGTCVLMRFPASQPEALPVESSGAYQVMARSGARKVLLVDDDELIQSSMQGMLALLGHQVTQARSGEEALAQVAGGLRPEVVILDMNMPGLGGAGTLPRLRALLPRVPVLLTTGRADHVAQDLVKAHPLVTLLSKPFGMKELQANLAPLN